MGSILTNGVFLPAEGERNCYEGLAANWVALDGVIGGYSAHAANLTIHVTATDKEAWNGKADASALTAHTGDTTIHVTAADKEAWNGKADASALTAHTGDTTIHVTSADKEAWDGHVADSVKHVTAADKAKWDAVTSKADDSNVVHKSGNETISGNKTFSSNITIYSSDTSVDARYLILKNQKVKRGSTTETGTQFITLQDKDGGTLVSYETNVSVSGNTQAYINVSNIDTNSRRVLGGIKIIKTPTETWFIPDGNNSVSSGLSNYKWSDVQTYKVNALEPSSLSLPSDRSARIDISSYFTNTGTGQSNSYTVPANGYIYLTLSELTNVHCFSRSSGDVTNYAQTFTKLSNSTGALYILFPVRKNDVFVATWYTTTTVSVDGAFFIPCKGNI